jgi:hypothetical protein
MVIFSPVFGGRVVKDVKDITRILYRIAVTAGVLIVAF